MRRLFGVVALLAIPGLACAAPPARAESMAAEAARAAIETAGNAIKSSKPAEAVAAVEPVIAALEEQEKEQTVRCADNQAQTLMVLLMQAAPSEMQPKAQQSNTEQRNTVVIDSAFCTALFLKGFALIDLQRWDDAEPFLRRAHETTPLSAHYLNEYAEWHKAMKQFDKAHALFGQAFDLGEYSPGKEAKASDQARALRGMAFAEIEMGQLDKAEVNLKKSLKLVPGHPGAKAELDYIAAMRKKL